MLPKKKLISPWGGHQRLFGKRPEVSKHQEQEAANAIEKDDAKANEESAQAKSAKCKEQRFFEPWLKTYWSTKKMEIICIVKSAQTLANRTE